MDLQKSDKLGLFEGLIKLSLTPTVISKKLKETYLGNLENVLEAVSTDCVIFGFEDKKLKILLVNRLLESMRGTWALPGGFILKDENLGEAPLRILKDMANLTDVYLEQIAAFGEVNRFPHARTVTVGYYALVNPSQFELCSFKSEALEARWFNLSDKPSLPYDHNLIAEAALDKLKLKLRHEPIGFELLPDKFSLRQLQDLYEAIIGVDLDNRNFRKKILKMDVLRKLNEKQNGVKHRQAVLYQFDAEKYKKLPDQAAFFTI